MTWNWFDKDVGPQRCALCGQRSRRISSVLGVCGRCIISKPDEAVPLSLQAHRRSRQRFHLPPEIPRPQSGFGPTCRVCGNRCQLSDGAVGYCGLRKGVNGRIHSLAGTSTRALVSWYHDPLPTNCVASWVCPAGSGAGYPKFAVRPGPEYGYTNLAVFYEACSFDCLFCQNWHFRRTHPGEVAKERTAQELADAVTPRDTCICFFGGDPGPQMPHAIRASRLAIARTRDLPLRICWETNGNLSHPMLRAAFELSLRTGGCIKFDLKAYSEPLAIALTGVSNRLVLENFRWAASRFRERPDPPPVVASTLLVPGYVTADEVRKIANFIASLNPDIPYSLLAFAPQFEMSDLPPTSRQEAEACYEAAVSAGLSRVHIGNRHLLWDDKEAPRA